MKKWFALLLFMTAVLYHSLAFAEQEAVFRIGVGKYSINGWIRDDVAPYIKNGRAYLPMRYVAYAIGIGDNSIYWDDERKIAYLAKPGLSGELVVVEIPVGENYIMVGNERRAIDAPAEIKNGRTMLPVRAVAEAFGCKVHWDAQNKVVRVIGD